MKFTKCLSMLSIAVMALMACDGPTPSGPSGPSGPSEPSKEDTTKTVVVIDTTKAISFAQAIATADSQTDIVIIGYVTKAFTTSPSKTGELQQTAWLAEQAKSSAGTIEAYYCNITDSVSKGDRVAVQGKVSKFVQTGGDTIYEIKNGYMQILSKSAPAVVTGEGTADNPFTVSDVIALASAQEGPFYVKGYIVGQVDPNGKSISASGEYAAPFTGNNSNQGTNLLIADAANETQTGAMAPVQLPSGFRAFSLPATPANLGKEILIYGKLINYFGQPGVKNGTYFVVDGTEYGSKPTVVTGDELLNEDLQSQASFDKFTIVNVTGTLTWVYDSKYPCAKMSGYASGSNSANEDWFISPAFDATNAQKLTFDHARGPVGSMSVAVKDHYTVWISNNFQDSIASTTWTELPVANHGTTAWAYVNSGEIAIPAANKAPNCRIAWKYVCDDKESATWEVKNIIVK